VNMEAGDGAVQVHTDRGTVNINGVPVTISDIRQLSLDASRAEVLPAARAVASETAVAVIDQRIGELTDKVLEKIKQKNPGLFARWDDPRFLAALTSALRSYAETGDEDLADLQANLLVALASQPIRSRREIILRQAIDVAPRLTTEHINALAVNMYLGNYKLTQPLDADGLIQTFDALLCPYYGRLPTSALDYQYMSSTGVGYTDQLQAFGGGPYQVLYRRYRNLMYPAFTFAEMQTSLLSDENENRQEDQKLLGLIAESEDAFEQTESGLVVRNPEAVYFRIAPEHAESVLTNDGSVESKLSESQATLRNMVLQRSLTEAELQQRVRELRPQLADFLDFFQRTGGLGFHLHPVGFILARHEIASRAPQMADLIDSAFDES
jgi:hypothetical protein